MIKQRAEEQRRQREAAQNATATTAQQPVAPASTATTEGTNDCNLSHHLQVKSFDTCQLQIRLNNGQRLNASFSAKDKVSDVVNYVSKNRNDGKNTGFLLSIAYPKKDLTGDLLHATLEEAGLVPRCALVMTDK